MSEETTGDVFTRPLYQPEDSVKATINMGQGYAVEFAKSDAWPEVLRVRVLRDNKVMLQKYETRQEFDIAFRILCRK
jgi:hypothetical protein